MSDKPRDLPPDWRHGGPLPEEPPGLQSDLLERPRVQELLAELSKDLKPGEDPLYHELPEEPDDPAACAPNEARVYVPPAALPKPLRHKTLEVDRVKVSPRVDPRRAVTERVRLGSPVEVKDDAPPMSGPASNAPKGDARKKRTVLGAVLLTALAAAIGIAARMRGPKGIGQPAVTAIATVQSDKPAIPSAAPAPPPAATSVPAATASLTATPSVTPSPVRPQPAPARLPKEENPYDAASASPVATAPSAAPAVTTSTMPPQPVAPKGPPAVRSVTPAPTSGPILGEKE